MTDRKNLYIVILSLIIVIIVLVGIFILYPKYSALKNTIAQIEASYQDSLKIVKTENGEYYHRIIELSKLSSIKDGIINKKDEVIISNVKIIAKLNEIISSGLGTTDTIIQNECLGLNLAYSDSNALRKLDVNVEVNNPPKFFTKEEFNPINFEVYISRKKEILNGYLKIPDNLKEFITINDFKVIYAIDEFKELNHNIIDFIKIGPSISSGLSKGNKNLISLGGQILIKEAHLIGYEKEIGSNYHWIHYSYFPDFLSF